MGSWVSGVAALAGWHETSLTPKVDFVHFVDESHPRSTSAGQTIGKLQSHAVFQKMAQLQAQRHLEVLRRGRSEVCYATLIVAIFAVLLQIQGRQTSGSKRGLLLCSHPRDNRRIATMACLLRHHHRCNSCCSSATPRKASIRSKGRPTSRSHWCRQPRTHTPSR